VKHFGEFLDPSFTTLPRSSVTVALVYNAKGEASSQSPLNADQQVSPRASQPLSPSLPDEHEAAAVSSALRVNDLHAEWDTMETINAVRFAIEERFPVTMIEADEHAFEKLKEQRPDFVFNIAEGLHGSSREAQMPAIMEMLCIPYLGSDPLTLSICLDKSRTKEILSYHGIPTAPFHVISSMEMFEEVRVRFPLMVKPLHEGSSKGIYNSCVVRNAAELEHEVRTILDSYHEPALVEEFLPGREFTVALMGNGENLQILPIVEIKFDALPDGMNPIYSYEAKWIWDRSDDPLDIFECPARLSPVLQQEIESICVSTFRVLRCRDWSRIDVRLDDRGKPHIIEINPLPGILPKPEDNSCFPKAARAAGMSYNQLINAVLDIAMERCGVFAPETAHQGAEINQ
jgi:D-alanine-D-alanine ligase